jgi:hypothetical protein
MLQAGWSFSRPVRNAGSGARKKAQKIMRNLKSLVDRTARKTRRRVNRRVERNTVPRWRSTRSLGKFARARIFRVRVLHGQVIAKPAGIQNHEIERLGTAGKGYTPAQYPRRAAIVGLTAEYQMDDIAGLIALHNNVADTIGHAIPAE